MPTMRGQRHLSPTRSPLDIRASRRASESLDLPENKITEIGLTPRSTETKITKIGLTPKIPRGRWGGPALDSAPCTLSQAGICFYRRRYYGSYAQGAGDRDEQDTRRLANATYGMCFGALRLEAGSRHDQCLGCAQR